MGVLYVGWVENGDGRLKENMKGLYKFRSRTV